MDLAAVSLLSFALRIALQRWMLGYVGAEQKLAEYVRPALKVKTGETAAATLRRAQWLITSGYSLALGPLLAGVLNVFTSQKWALERSLGALDRFLNLAQKQAMPVSVTLDTGKIYVGLVASITDPDTTPALVTLLPMFSGYRDPRGQIVPDQLEF